MPIPGSNELRGLAADSRCRVQEARRLRVGGHQRTFMAGLEEFSSPN